MRGEGYKGEANCLHVFLLLCNVTRETTKVVRRRIGMEKDELRVTTTLKPRVVVRSLPGGKITQKWP